MAIVKLYAARDGMEAHHLRAMLEAEGIEATVMGELLGTARGELPLTQETLPSVWVDESDMEAAARVVERLQDPPIEEGKPDWTCPACGEQIERQFDACWHCETERP